MPIELQQQIVNILAILGIPAWIILMVIAIRRHGRKGKGQPPREDAS